MKDFIFQQLALPLLRRAGTMLGTGLVAMGADQDIVGQTVNVILAIGLVVIDLINSYSDRRAH